jgi:hypothetical protein
MDIKRHSPLHSHEILMRLQQLQKRQEGITTKVSDHRFVVRQWSVLLFPFTRFFYGTVEQVVDGSIIRGRFRFPLLIRAFIMVWWLFFSIGMLVGLGNVLYYLFVREWREVLVSIVVTGGAVMAGIIMWLMLKLHIWRESAREKEIVAMLNAVIDHTERA